MEDVIHPDIYRLAADLLQRQVLVWEAGFCPGSEDGRTLVALLASPEVPNSTVEDVWALASTLIVAPDWIPSALTE